MLAAADPTLLRSAIARRDGEDDARLDDAEVKSLIGELPRDEPLEAYADLAQLRREDPDAAAMAKASLGPGAWAKPPPPWVPAPRAGARRLLGDRAGHRERRGAARQGGPAQLRGLLHDIARRSRAAAPGLSDG